ncbi:hypothetical protein G7046_g1098 [Stylonectria norvegica]|nr:hypothetical protein G7046_g1098 [Stylonectria norvegica]
MPRHQRRRSGLKMIPEEIIEEEIEISSIKSDGQRVIELTEVTDLDPSSPTPPSRWQSSPWLIVLGSFLSNSASFGVMNSFGTFQTFHQAEILRDMSTATISWIGSVQASPSNLFLLFLGGMAFGPALDSWGPRRLMIPGFIVCLLSFLFVSFSTDYWQILVTQGFFFGIGNALLYYPTTTAITKAFDHNRSLALGIAVSGSSIGGIYWPIIIEKLLHGVGFSWTHRIMAAVSMPLLAISCFLVREQATTRVCEAPKRTGASSTGKMALIFQDMEYLMLSISLFFVYMGMLVPFYYIPMHAIYHGIDQQVANNLLLPMCYAASFIATVTGATTVFWTLMTTIYSMIAFAILFGFCSGGLIPLGAGCVAQITSEMDHVTLVGGPIGGSLLEVGEGGNDWNAVNCFSGLSVLFGAGMILYVRMHWKGSGKLFF